MACDFLAAKSKNEKINQKKKRVEKELSKKRTDYKTQDARSANSLIREEGRGEGGWADKNDGGGY